MIDCNNLVKQYGPLCAVDDLSFSVEPGEVLGFLGPNGAGKSTTMRIIAGFLAPTSGSVKVCGNDVETEAIAAKRRIGYLPEGAPSYPEMTPRSFLSFVAEARGIPANERRRRLDDVVGLLHLESVIEQSIETLSKGYKRRVGLAQAILHDPEVLILDEPTDGLDPNQKFEVRDLIAGMAKSKIIVISTHLLEEARVLQVELLARRGQCAGARAELARVRARFPRSSAAKRVTSAVAALPEVDTTEIDA